MSSTLHTSVVVSVTTTTITEAAQTPDPAAIAAATSMDAFASSWASSWLAAVQSVPPEAVEQMQRADREALVIGLAVGITLLAGMAALLGFWYYHRDEDKVDLVARARRQRAAAAATAAYREARGGIEVYAGARRMRRLRDEEDGYGMEEYELHDFRRRSRSGEPDLDGTTIGPD